MMQIAILGAGMVGRAIAIDLSTRYQVTSFDISEQSLTFLSQKNTSIKTQQADLADFGQYTSLLTGYDIVVCAVPGFMGFRALKAIIEAGKNVVDISFFPENALELDALAKEKRVTAIVDCGVAPGLSNLILGYYDTQMKIEKFECMVGGLPKTRVKPFEYKAPFSPIDVLEEYSRPARYVENGHIVTKPALSDAELIDFEKAGTLESFNTDGLRSILFTMGHIPNMKEKTLRYPGHIDLIAALQKAGFFNTDEINVKGKMVRPLDLTSALLFDQWKLQEEEAEFTIMKIILEGMMDGALQKIEYDIYDEYDAASKTSSMSRTTGYTCTAAVNLISEKLFEEKGVFPPELVGKNKVCFDFILSYLEERKISCNKKVTKA
jgi:saccharopine dehydrogenase-like NADP-dependent oxidoreductase